MVLVLSLDPRIVIIIIGLLTTIIITGLLTMNHVICVESLAVKNLVKNHCLAKAISDVGWGEFVRQLEYKSEWYGRTLIKIDQFYPSSKTCSTCKHVVDSL